MKDRITEPEFRALPQDDQVARLRLLAVACLENYGLDKASEIALLNHRENAVFSINDPVKGEKFALRVHRAGYQTEKSITSELVWMEALTEAGIVTPSIIPGLDGKTVQAVDIAELHEVHYCDLLAWVEGAPLEDDSNTFKILGAANARLHAFAKNWTPPEGFERQVWDEAGMLGPEPIWGRFQDLENLDPEKCALLEQARNKALARLEVFGKSENRFGLIHADMMPENILVSQGKPFVIDFDDGGFGWYLYDLGTLFGLQVADDGWKNNLAAWAEGYRSVEPLPDEDLAELPTFLMCRLLVGLGWLHSRKETSMAQEFTDDFIDLACFMAGEYLAA